MISSYSPPSPFTSLLCVKLMVFLSMLCSGFNVFQFMDVSTIFYDSGDDIMAMHDNNVMGDLLVDRHNNITKDNGIRNEEAISEVASAVAATATTPRYNENNCFHDKRKFLMIHIGPSKTGTTTIQWDSADWDSADWDSADENSKENYTSSLLKDDAIYAGKYARDRRKRQIDKLQSCLFNLYQNNSIDENIQQCQPNWSLLNHSIVVSEEGYSYTTFDINLYRSLLHYLVSNNINNDKQNNGNQSSLCFEGNTVPKYDELIMVATYRRYYEWIVSAMTEGNTANCLGTWKTTNASPERQQELYEKHKESKWLEFDGKACPNPWAWVSSYVRKENDFNARFYYNIGHTISQLRSLQQEQQQIGNNNMHVHILNFHSKNHNSITTALYCDILGMGRTPKTCKYSKERGSDLPVRNKGSMMMTAYDTIVLAASKTKPAMTTNDATAVNGTPTTLIDIHNISRRDARQQLADYHTKTLGMNYTNLPLICPPKNELESLLRKSLTFEQMMMPEFYKTNKEEHIQSFWKLVNEQKVYCWVDTDQLLHNVTSWKQLLEERMAQTWSTTTWQNKVQNGHNKHNV